MCRQLRRCAQLSKRPGARVWDAHPAPGDLTEPDADRRKVGLVPDLRTENLRVQTLGYPLGRTLGIGERLGQRVHLVDSGKAQQQRPPSQRQPGAVLSRAVHVDRCVLRTGQQCDRPGADRLVLVRHRPPRPLRRPGAGRDLPGHGVPLSLREARYETRPRCQQVGPANHFPGPPEHGVLKGRAQRSGRSGPSAARRCGGSEQSLSTVSRSDRARRGVGRREPLGRFIGPLPWSPHPPLTKSGGRGNNHDDGPEPWRGTGGGHSSGDRAPAR